MSAEQLPQTEVAPQVQRQLSAYARLAKEEWGFNLSSLLFRPGRTLLLEASFQKLCAESLCKELRDMPQFQTLLGGKALEVVMVPTTEPYMYNVGIKLADTLSE